MSTCQNWFAYHENTKIGVISLMAVWKCYIKKLKNNKDLLDKTRLCGNINFNNKTKIRPWFCMAAKNSKTAQWNFLSHLFCE